ncbi:TetR/AcrR family transcriptional regulator [Massilia sp. SM-13]|uniref:TetR/AcrR family transcriptional regulator n=1 Tax=Pseudoduganella rhizocola TaxID=3382643 RepID=UPI0038B49E6C
MRKSRIEAAETRERIVAAASEEFRQAGIAGTGLTALMAGAGLTHGGFYKHFDSKEQVAAEACAHAIGQIESAMRDAGAAHRGTVPLHGAIDSYLSAAHRDTPQRGCPFAALGAELGRSGGALQATASEGIERMVALFAQQNPASGHAEARRSAMVALSGMVGALMLARLAAGEQLSNELLKAMRQHLGAQVPGD